MKKKRLETRYLRRLDIMLPSHPVIIQNIRRGSEKDLILSENSVPVHRGIPVNTHFH